MVGERYIILYTCKRLVVFKKKKQISFLVAVPHTLMERARNNRDRVYGSSADGRSRNTADDISLGYGNRRAKRLNNFTITSSPSPGRFWGAIIVLC